jgi:hypothetical protein
LPVLSPAGTIEPGSSTIDLKLFPIMRLKGLLLAGAVVVCAAPLAAQQRAAPAQPVLSPRDTARLALGDGKQVMVDYGRPLRRGRRIMGELVPWGRPWRTGANAATTFVTDVDLQIGGVMVPRGTYTLYTLPTPGRWTLIINRQTGQWGTQYEPSRDLARVPMRYAPLRDPVEQFTISLQPVRAGQYEMSMEWETTRVSVPVRVVRPAAAAVRR